MIKPAASATKLMTSMMAPKGGRLRTKKRKKTN
jgi:hypothetical protein